MLSFREILLSDIEIVKNIFKTQASQSCDATFGNLFLWQQQHFQRVCIFEDTLFLRYGDEYLFPVGKMPIKQAINLILEDAKERNVPFKMKLVTENQVNILKENFEDRFEFNLDRNNSDYVYETISLITLSGKKYHAKRNHIAKFDRKYNWTYEKMSEQNIPECKKMNEKWEQQLDIKDKSIINEHIALEKAFENFLTLNFKGGVLRVDGEVIAFSLGEEISENTFCTHFEKAISSFEGAYAKMNNEFTKNELSTYQFVNREEDMGIEGIRKAKTSYNPSFILNKYTVTYKK